MPTSINFHDPALIAAVRGSLATRFAKGVQESLLDVADALGDAAADTSDKDEKKSLREAASQLLNFRTKLPASVSDEVARCFDTKLDSGDGFSKTARFTLDTLTLVEDHQMLEEIALGHAAKRLKEQCDFELYALTHRVGLLTGKDYLNVDASPVYPSIFTRGLLEALKALGCEPAHRLAIFKAFSPPLLEVAQSAYAEANKTLVERGVDIEINSNFGKPVLRPDRPNLGAPVRQQDPHLSEAVTHLFNSMASAALATSAPAPTKSDAESTAPVTLAMPSSLKPETANGADEPANIVQQTPRQEDNRLDLIVADIVAAMFDHLFADARIPSTIKAQVGRLQIPILKLAMRDRSVFTEPDHAVRRLIDGMAEFGIAHDKLFDDGTTSAQSIATITEDIVRDHSANPEVFTAALARLDRLMEYHDEIALGSDAVVMGLEDGERAELAKAAAQHEIQSRIAGRELPIGINAFLQTSWRDLLVKAWQSGGSSGPEWKLEVGAIDQLLASIAPADSKEARVQLAKMLPSLIEIIKDAADRAGADKHLADQLFEELRSVHTATASGAAQPYDIKPPPPPVVAADPEATVVLPSSILGRHGLARGTWVEFIEADGKRPRARVTWISTAKGTSLFKNYDENRSFAIGLDDLLKQLEAGTAIVVEGVGVARASIEGAIREITERQQNPA